MLIIWCQASRPIDWYTGIHSIKNTEAQNPTIHRALLPKITVSLITCSFVFVSLFKFTHQTNFLESIEVRSDQPTSNYPNALFDNWRVDSLYNYKIGTGSLAEIFSLYLSFIKITPITAAKEESDKKNYFLVNKRSAFLPQNTPEAMEHKFFSYL